MPHLLKQANKLKSLLRIGDIKGYVIFTEFFRGESMLDILANTGHFPIQVFKIYFINLVKVVYFFYRRGVVFDSR
jgi:hypothetical protein